MPRRILLILTIISTLALLTAGCGGGSGATGAMSTLSGKAIHEVSGGVCCNPPTFTPLDSALIDFTTTSGRVVQTKSDSAGNYTVQIPSGTYIAALADRANEPSYSNVNPAQIVVPPNSTMTQDITFQLLAP